MRVVFGCNSFRVRYDDKCGNLIYGRSAIAIHVLLVYRYRRGRDLQRVIQGPVSENLRRHQ